MLIPKVHHAFRENWYQQQYDLCTKYQSGEYSFIPNLIPEQAIEQSTPRTLDILYHRLGDNYKNALDPNFTTPSPVGQQSDGNWLKTVNMVGINVRTIKNFWNIVKYALTLPASQPSIHILPIWEVGVVDSLYGMSTWHINPEFFSKELALRLPNLDTVEKQLKVVVNILHALGKSVGMDVIPHTDRYSEIALCNPHYFEWLQREDYDIVDHRANLHEEVQLSIMQYLNRYGSATMPSMYPTDIKEFFYSFPEKERARVLFGEKNQLNSRNARRNGLVQHLFNNGFEPVPATMAPPYRGIKVDIDNAAKTIDYDGRVWRDYTITKPEPMSRVFGPLARYKLYDRLDDNKDWQIDFDKPITASWEYVATKYAEVQATYNFDFMRGDMSHVQMRKDGVPPKADDYYDLLRYIKLHIQKNVPYFGYFAETFIAPAGHMAYGDEIDHLELSEAETTLGDLQSVPVGSTEFIQRFRQYYDILKTRTCVPNFTLMTGDKDDPRFDGFYLKGNETRYFISLFLGDMPTYMALGFECRDVHHQPAPNEHYTKLYVFQIQDGTKATRGPYRWGKNGTLFHKITRLRLFGEQIFDQINGKATHWLLPPDATGFKKIIAWTQADTPQYIFLANLDTDEAAINIKMPMQSKKQLQQVFSTENNSTPEVLTSNGLQWHVNRLEPGEGRVYEILS